MIGIIGSGNLGANTAFFLAERGVEDVLLYDIDEGQAKGKALDMMEVAPLRSYRKGVKGVDRIEELFKAKVILIAAGITRKQEGQNTPLYQSNHAIISDLGAALRSTEAVILLATEPVDALTTLFLKSSKLPSQKVIGLGGTIDSCRLRYLISQELSLSPENITALVIGPHSESMIPLARYSRVEGVPVDRLIPPEKLQPIFEQTRGMQNRFIDLGSNPFYGPSAAAADLIAAICQDSHQIYSVSVLLTGEYSIKGVAMSLPVVIGGSGIEKVLQPDLSDVELAELKASAAELERTLQLEVKE